MIARILLVLDPWAAHYFTFLGGAEILLEGNSTLLYTEKSGPCIGATGAIQNVRTYAKHERKFLLGNSIMMSVTWVPAENFPEGGKTNDA